MGECRFCTKARKLVKSHIVPQALHKEIQADNGPMQIYEESHPWGVRSPTGAYGRFLCRDCEKRVGQDDEYGIQFVRKYGDGSTGEPWLGSFENGFVAHVCYTRFKLWVLSMLWRADACDHGMYKRVNLGEKWRKRLTDSLRARDPSDADYFAVTATLFYGRDDEENYGQAVMFDPHPENCAGVNRYRFYVYGGFTFFIKVDQRKQLEKLAALTLKQGKPLAVPRRKFSPGERSQSAKILGPP